MRASHVLRPVWSRRIDLRRAVTHDFPLKAAAVLIAVLFWAANTQNREVTVVFDGRVPVERPDVRAGYVLRGQLGDVGVTVRGADAAVKALALADLHASVDISAIEPGRAELQDAPIRVAASDPQVKVVDVSPAMASVRLERIITQTQSVQPRYANTPPQGWQAADATVAPAQVRVIGPESDISRIAAVYATVLFGDVTTDLTQSVPAVPVDASGATVDGLQVEPSVVLVTVPLLPTATTRTVPVLWSLRGSVATGFWISRVETEPVAVTVRGEQKTLANLDHLDTAAVDVSGLTSNRTATVPLVLPAGVTLLRPTDATVTLTVVPLTGSRLFPQVAVQPIGLGSGLVAESEPPSVSVTLNGPLGALGALTPDQVVGSVDAGGRGAGTYVLDVTVRFPAAVAAQAVQPTRVTLTIRTRS